MSVVILPITEAHTQSFHACLDSVAQERKFLGQTKAAPIERIAEFVRNNVANGHPQYVAVQGSQVVGWCDAVPHWAPALKHRANLGMGILKEHRRRGMGEQLLRVVIQRASALGLKRVDLEVRADNFAAIGLYEKCGFQIDGRKKMGLCYDGEFYDVLEMGLLIGHSA